MEDMLKNITRALHDASKTMLEANKANKAKKSAFRAGAKDAVGDTMPNKAYRFSSDKYKPKEELKAKDDARAAEKAKVKDKASMMKNNAKEKLKKLGKSPKGAVAAFNKGKEVQKAPIASTHAADKSVNHNADVKKYDGAEYAKKDGVFKHSGEGRGRFKQMHDTHTHEKIRRKIEDVHDSIRKKLEDLKPSYSATREEGSKAIDTAKAHLAKLNKLHAAIHEEAADEAYTEIVAETLELVEEVAVLAELYGDKE